MDSGQCCCPLGGHPSASSSVQDLLITGWITAGIEGKGKIIPAAVHFYSLSAFSPTPVRGLSKLCHRADWLIQHCRRQSWSTFCSNSSIRREVWGLVWKAAERGINYLSTRNTNHAAATHYLPPGNQWNLQRIRFFLQKKLGSADEFVLSDIFPWKGCRLLRGAMWRLVTFLSPTSPTLVTPLCPPLLSSW